MVGILSRFLFGFSLFSGAFAASFREGRFLPKKLELEKFTIRS